MKRPGASAAFALSICLLLILSGPTSARNNLSCQPDSISDGWRKLEHVRTSSKHDYTNIQRVKGNQSLGIVNSVKAIKLNSSRRIESHLEGELSSVLRFCGVELNDDHNGSAIPLSINEVNTLDILSCGVWIPHYDSCSGTGCEFSSFNRESHLTVSKPDLDFVMERDCAVKIEPNSLSKINDAVIFRLNANNLNGDLRSFGCFLPTRSSDVVYNKLILHCISSLLYLISDEKCVSEFDVRFRSTMNIGVGERLCR